MVVTLSRQDDRFVLELDRSLLASLQIDESTELEVSTIGRSLIVSPREDAARREQFAQALESTNRRYGNALKRLAE